MKTTPRSSPGNVRIVGGRWRGTRLSVPEMAGLRPSSDRVRETLFNWLASTLPDARVIDVFAGTGALGLEALSRGAAHAVLLERDPGLVRTLRDTATRLSATGQLEIVQGDALTWLAKSSAGIFDIAFVDPPFGADLWQATLTLLLPTLASGALLYLESPSEKIPRMPLDWSLHREGHTRDVRFALYCAPVAHGADTLNGNLSVAVPE